MTDDRAPLVSVVVPCWNLETHLDETLRSVAAQTWQRFEVLMVDDGSTDRTWEVMQNWAKQDARFHPIRLPVNRGLVAARNAGLARANGEFIALLDGDDIWTSDAVEHRVAVASRYPEADVIATDYSWFEHEISPTPSGHVTLGPKARHAFSACHAKGEPLFLRDPFDLVATIHFAWVGATLVRGSAMESIGDFDPNFRTQEDTLLWLRLANRGSFVYSPRITAHYRQRQGSIVHSLKEPNEFHYLKVLDWVSDRPEFRKHRRIIDAIMADCHYISAVHFRSCRDYGRAKFHAKNALKLHPTSFSYWREFIASWAEAARN